MGHGVSEVLVLVDLVGNISFGNVELVLESVVLVLDVAEVGDNNLVVLEDLSKSSVLSDGEVVSGFVVVADSQESGAFSSTGVKFSVQSVDGFTELGVLLLEASNNGFEVGNLSLGRRPGALKFDTSGSAVSEFKVQGVDSFAELGVLLLKTGKNSFKVSVLSL